jgi:hypothetical protein
MKIGERIIIVRAVRGQFLRICGLNLDERKRLKKRLHRFVFTENKLLVVKYGTNGRLEVEDAGTRNYPYEKRIVHTADLQMEITELMKKFFAATA